MAQELGETVQEMMKDDLKEIESIMSRRKSDHYWIVIHHKPTNNKLSSGELVIRKVIKDYDVQPRPLLGTIVLEVQNGRIINEEVNLHDAPIDWQTIERYAGWSENPLVQEKPEIAPAYIYNQ